MSMLGMAVTSCKNLHIMSLCSARVTLVIYAHLYAGQAAQGPEEAVQR